MNYEVGTLWNYITQLEASKVSINTYSKATTVKSDLMNSYAWDTAIVYIEEAGHANYVNQTTRNTSDEVCKINDMASNVSEYTTEYYTYTNGGIARPCTGRGGFYYHSNRWTASRYYGSATDRSSNYGFRFSLYM